MAGGRKRGANKAKVQDLSLGDLVLAKVKGFPAWPAKISRPEDWDRDPDLKKYFVQFFGTQEIAFVAPGDIQAFTSETKNKLTAKTQGKTKYFIQAVEEICLAFEELQKEKSCSLSVDTDKSRRRCNVTTSDYVEHNEDNKTEADIKGGIVSARPIEETKTGGFHKGETDNEDLKPSVSGRSDDGSSPVISFERKRKISNGLRPKKVLSTSSLDDPSDAKDKVSPVENKTSHLDHSKNPSNDHEKNKVSQKAKKVASGSKRRFEDVVEGQKISKSVVTSMKDEKADPEEQLNGLRGKDSVSRMGIFSPGARKTDLLKSSGSKGKDLVRAKRNLKASDVERDSLANSKGETSGKKKNGEPGVKRLKSGTEESLHLAKKSKFMDIKSDISRGLNGKGMKNNSFGSDNVKEVEVSEFKSLTSPILALRAPTAVGSDNSGDEAVLPLPKRHRKDLEAMLDSSDPKIVKSSRDVKSSTQFSREVKVSGVQLPKRRRAVCLYDDDEDDDPKTPVYGGSVRSVKEPSLNSDASKKPYSHPMVSTGARPDGGVGFEDAGPKEAFLQVETGPPSPILFQTIEGEPAATVSLSPKRSEAERLSSKGAIADPAFPKKSPQSASTKRPVIEQPKGTRAPVKVSSNGTQKKTQPVPAKGYVQRPASVKSSQSQVPAQRNKLAVSVDRPKSTPKEVSRINDGGVPIETLLGPYAVGEDRNSSLTDSKTPDSVTSMKHLIAAAQAKRKLAHSQQFALGNTSSVFLSISDVQGMSPIPSMAQPLISASSNFVQTDIQPFPHRTNLISPSNLSYQPASQNQLETEEIEERRTSSGHRAAGGSLSGGTEAAVARDAFEGMIETLSRTKESIGRATRLAIDCAKYGIANEVVELLIRKLESEPDFGRKVDLFFLVDSITQCSHNHKGVAGASYIPIVQAALPRLLAAAAPSGSGARENRRQCLKVMGLWLERRIFPQSVLRRYMDDLGGSKSDIITGFSLRRPSRSERAIDDPIREMEGMLVDEYGSNATFQLPGFLPSNAFEEDEDEDLPSIPCKELSDASPVEPDHTLDSEACCFTPPNDRRHHILEDVDGELEMEDVSGNLKEERSFTKTSSMDLQHQGTDMLSEPASSSGSEFPHLLEGSPPLPPDSPPPLPPLPSSPPPPPPPPASFPSPPPPPPPPLTQPPPFPAPPPVPLSFAPQQLVPPQSSLSTQSVLPPQTQLKSSPQLAYQLPVPHEYASTSNAHQIVQRVGNTSQGVHMDAIEKSDLFLQQSSCFGPMGVCTSRDPSGYNSSRQLEYGRNDIYVNPQSSQPCQQFQPNITNFVQRPLHPMPQNPSAHFSFTKPVVPQHPQHPYPSYSLASQHDSLRQYGNDDQWRMPSADYNSDNQRGGWVPGRNPSHAGPLFAQEGYFRPPVERPPPNNMGFPINAANNLTAGPSSSGHVVSHILPCRPDMSTVNSWRPG